MLALRNDNARRLLGGGRRHRRFRRCPFNETTVPIVGTVRFPIVRRSVSFAVLQFRGLITPADGPRRRTCDDTLSLAEAALPAKIAGPKLVVSLRAL